MNVSLKNTDAVNGVITVGIVKADYAEKVDKGLRNFRQKANVPGFRKGMVPMGMVRKMYGKSVLMEEINKLVSENLFGYIRENKLNVLGEPLPSLTDQKEIDFDTQEDFEFAFDIALAPEVNVQLGKEDTLPYYQIAIDDAMVDSQVNAYKSQMGTYEKADEAEAKDMLKGTLVELENGEPKEGGILVENAVLMPEYMKNDEEKNKFIGAKNNSVITFNPNKAYDGAEAEIASLLKIDKAAVAEHTGDFNFEIMEITRHKDAELNAELFEKVFGKDVVATEEEFRNKIKEALTEQTEPESNFKFMEDARDVLVAKAGDLQFPDAFLKRWMKVSDEKKTEEEIEASYPKIIEDLKYHLIKEALVKANGIQVEDADINAFAQRVAKSQFAQYGMLSVPDDVLDRYAKDMLKNQDTARNILDHVVEEKLAAFIKETVTLDEKTVSSEEFRKLFE